MNQSDNFLKMKLMKIFKYFETNKISYSIILSITMFNDKSR